MIALGTDTDGHERLARRKRYRWGYFASLVVGVVGLIAASRLGYPLVGVGIYWLGALAMFAILWGSPVTLFDEREQRRERQAAAITLGVVTVLGVVSIPGLVALENAGVLAIPAWVHGMFLAYVVLFAVFGLVLTALWLRR